MILGSSVNGQEYEDIHNEKKTKPKYWIAVQPSKWVSENDLQQENGTEGDKLLTVAHRRSSRVHLDMWQGCYTCWPHKIVGNVTHHSAKLGTANLNFLH